jgi:hypothetical protein
LRISSQQFEATMIEDNEKTKRKTKSKVEVKLPNDQDFREQIFNLSLTMKELQAKISDLLLDPVAASIPELKGIRAQETKRMFVVLAKICNRNNVPTINLYPFLIRAIKEFGFCGTNEGLKNAEEFCKDGRPEGMVHVGAKKWFEEYGNHDAAYLDALLCERGGLVFDTKAISRSHGESFASKLVKPFTDRATKSLTRLEYLHIVRNHCLENSAIYKPALVIQFFNEKLQNLTDLNKRILGREDVPNIDFDYLKGNRKDGIN